MCDNHSRLAKRARLASGFIALGATIAIISCGQAAVSCDRDSACPADVVPPWGTSAACSYRSSGGCGSYWSALLECMQRNQVCLDAFTDENAQNTACGGKQFVYAQCCEGPDAGLPDTKHCSPP